MAVALGEPGHLVLDGGAITRPLPLDLPGKHGCAVDIRVDDRVPLRRCARNMAGDLRECRRTARELGEGHGLVVAILPLQTGPIDGVPVQARRGAGLQTAHGETALPEEPGQFKAGPFPKPAGRPGLLAEMNETAEKCACGHDD